MLSLIVDKCLSQATADDTQESNVRATTRRGSPVLALSYQTDDDEKITFAASVSAPGAVTRITTVKEVLAEQRANNPEAKIAYHSMFDIASTDKDAFGVKLEHEVFFIPAFTSGEEGGQSQSITQSTLAGKLPANTFENSHCVVATWSVKWSPQGLGPVRPLVLFKQSCDLPAGKAAPLM